MKNIIKVPLFLLVLPLFMTGCRTLDADVQRGPAQLKLPASYSWAPNITGIVGDSRINPKMLTSTVINHVEKHLNAEGLSKGVSGKADLVVDYAASLSLVSEEHLADYAGEERPAAMVSWSEKSGLQRGAGQEVEMLFYEAGTLVVTITDRLSEKTVWVGTTALKINPDVGAEGQKVTIKQALHKVLKQFP